MSAFRDLADVGAATMESLLADALGKAPYCIGFHLRHALDAESPHVVIRSSHPSEADLLASKLRKLGLGTLNHVIDSLQYLKVPLAARAGQSVEVTCVEIDFSKTGAAKPHALMFEGRAVREFPRFCVDHFRMKAHWMEPWSLSGCSFDTDVARFIDTPLQLPNAQQAGWSSIYHGFVCGAQGLCEALGIPKPTMASYRAIIAAVLQLGEYTPQFGNQTATFLLRSSKSFGAVVGLTIISHSAVVETVEADVVAKLVDLMEKATRSRAPEKQRPQTVSTDPVLNRVAEITSAKLALPPAELSSTGIRQQITRFIQLSTTFCEETLEGRPVQYGLLLGLPNLIRHWPGSPAIKLPKYQSSGPKENLLLEPPDERIIVVPYVQEMEPEPDLFVLELAGALEAIHSNESSAVWDRSLRPIVYLTMRFPWAVGIVVGPGAAMRVFAKGWLMFFRDGKGWKEYLHSDLDLSELADRCWGAADESYRRRVGLLVRFALQYSPLARPQSHGALLLWLPCELDEGIEAVLRNHSRVLGGEEPKHEFGLPWITGRSLFRGGDPNEPDLEVDSDVARLAIRAGMSDGALVLLGQDAKVWGFRRQLAFPCTDGAGTRRTAAKAAIEFLEVPGAMAIAVSSDGPIRIFYRARHTGAVDMISLFTPIAAGQ